MKNILFIAYQFPPKSGIGVHRSINLVNLLPEFGYNPIVLTVNEKDWEDNGYSVDKNLLNNLKENLTIVRTPSYEPSKLIQFLMKIKLYRFFWYLFYPLLWEWSMFWSLKNFRLSKELIQQHDIKLVYTSSGPFSSMLLGRKLKKKLGVKWVADLRDPFTDAYAWQFPSKIHWYLARLFEKNLFSKPDILVVNTNEVKKLYVKRNYRDEKSIIVINNGF